MKGPMLKSFSDSSEYLEISKIILQHSSNKKDIRKVAVEGVDLSFAKEVMELGCGVGSMHRDLTKYISPNARFLGVDGSSENEKAFKEVVVESGRRPEFMKLAIDNILPWPDNNFDLVVCAYSLNSFVQIIPEIARVLKPNGIFLTIAHSEKSFVELNKLLGVKLEGSNVINLSKHFAAENGYDLLKIHFKEIESIEYINNMHFGFDDLSDLKKYMQFNLPFLIFEKDMEKTLISNLMQKDLIIRNDDAIFRCRKPVCH